MSEIADENLCSRCGAALPLISGLCPSCVAGGAVAGGRGWLLQGGAGADAGAEFPQIDGWVIVGTLGVGGMGRVYQAESEPEGTPAAIKVLDPRWSADPTMVARFQNEARLLQSLQHPNIVQLIGSSQTPDGHLCLIMELVQGCDLGRLLRAEKLSHERAFEIFDKVCRAVAHAHSHGFIHRDIKPSNILVGRSGETKLADFGLAREMVDGGGDLSLVSNLTATTDQFGTAYYMAPERMLGRQPPGPEADVYALGVLLYHLLAGQMPIGKFTPISALEGLPRELDAVIAAALEADPSKRTSSVTGLHDQAMGLWEAHQAGTLRIQKLRRAAVAAGALFVIVGGVIGGAWWQAQRMRPKAIVFPDPAAAVTDRPWENSLGMKFVPVPGTKVLFSIYETRRRDADAFMKASMAAFDVPWLDGETVKRLEALNHTLWNFRGEDGLWTKFSYDDPGWPITPEHPAFFVSAVDAFRMCAWLTWKEKQEGRLKGRQHYRLPTTEEWLAACGGPDAPVRAGNVAGPEARIDIWPGTWPTFNESDPFARTAPVGSFPVEPHGLYDMSGNVTEWVNDAKADPQSLSPVMARLSIQLRGPAFNDGTPEHASFRYVRASLPAKRVVNVGFRMVLDLQ